MINLLLTSSESLSQVFVVSAKSRQNDIWPWLTKMQNISSDKIIKNTDLKTFQTKKVA